MNDGVGRALWKVYEDAVQSLPGAHESGVARATLKFIRAFEQELSDAKIAPYCKAALERQSGKLAEVRSVHSRKS